MDFERSDTQRALRDALSALLGRYAGVARSRALAVGGDYDHALESALRTGGFLDLFADPGAGPLDAVLAVEQISAELGAITSVPHLLVLPALGLPAHDGPVVLAAPDAAGPVRYGAQAGRILIAGPDHCVAGDLDTHDATPLPSAFGYPLARVAVRGSLRHTEKLAPGSSRIMVNWWRLGVSAEALGMMQKALDLTVQYAKDRKVFKRPLGSFQALQHRLAELSVLVEGSRWLIYEAAFHGAEDEAAAVASAHTMAALHRLTRETHQIMGAIGLTREHDLHLWTLRMQALRAELGGLREHRRAVAESRWGAAAV